MKEAITSIENFTEKFDDLLDVIPDFPKPGISFKDVSPILENHFPVLIDALASLIDWSGIDAIGGIEARGFILGAALAQKVGIGFVPIRKKGKLPPPVISHSYELEYGSDTLEVKLRKNIDLKNKASYKKMIVVDDVLATGGTLKAAYTLLEQAGYKVENTLVIINLSFLNNFKQEDLKIQALKTY